MVQKGKGVVAISGGTESAKAILAELQIRRLGKPMFNFLITDDACANELLMSLGYRISDVPRRNDWWIKRHIFLVAFLKYSSTSRQTVMDIAKSLSLSAKQVKRFLECAAQGWANVEPMLSFQVKAPSPERALEASLLENCKLMEVRVTPTFEDKEQGLKLIGETGASFLVSLLRGQTKFAVGFGGGRAVRAVVESLNFKQLFHNLPFLKQLRICILDKNPLPKVLGVTAETILTPLLTSIEDKDKFVGCHYENLEDTSGLDAVFLSIGSLNPPDNIWVFLQEDKKLLAERDRLVGAMLFQFITHDGQVIPTRWAKELKVMPLSNLQRMVSENKPVVIVARGAHKADAIFTAYQMRLFNCLIVDRSLAEAILTRLCSTPLTSESMLNLPP